MWFALQVLKSIGVFACGFIAMWGFLSILTWLFGKTVAMVIGWLVVIVAWCAIITSMGLRGKL